MLFRFPYLLSPFVSWFSSRSLPLYCKFWLQEDSCVPLRFFPAHFAKTLLKKVSCTFIPQGTWYCLFFYPNRTVRKRVLKTQIQSFVRNQTLVKKRLTSLLTNNNSKWKEVNCLKRGKSERPMRDCFKFCIWLVESMGRVFWTNRKAKFSKTMASRITPSVENFSVPQSAAIGIFYYNFLLLKYFWPDTHPSQVANNKHSFLEDESCWCE